MLGFLETTGDRHLRLVGGVSALERHVRMLWKRGATKVIVAAPPVEPARPFPAPVEFVAPGTPPPEGAIVERADMIQGIELVDDAAVRDAEWKQIRSTPKSFEGPVDSLINWRASARIVRFISHRSLAWTPNQVTIVATLLGIAAALLVALGDYWAVAVGGVLVQTSCVLDGVDGELARLRFQYSKLGEWLDNVSDVIVDNLFIACCGIPLGGFWMWLAIGAALGRVLVAVVTMVDVYMRTGTGDTFSYRWWFETGKSTPDEVYDPKAISTWFRSFGRRDLSCIMWMVFCLCWFPLGVVVHGAIVSAVNVAMIAMQYTVFRGRLAEVHRQTVA